MDDPGEEWEIEEYHTSSGEEECKSKVSWILSRGLQLGTKVLITAVVISSAPVVLTPLLVVSAFGFAVSVPAGIVFASYACTEKLMNKLLPMPASSLKLEIEIGLKDDVEKEEESEFGGEFLQKEELEKQIADTKEEIEMRMDLREDGKKEQRVKGYEELEEEKLYKDESSKGKGYEEDVGEYREGEDEGSLGGLDVKTEFMETMDKESLIEEYKNEKPSPEKKRVVVVTGAEKKNANDVTKTDELIVFARGIRSDNKNVKMVTRNDEDIVLTEGTMGLLEKIRDECDIGESVKKNKKNKHHGKKSHGVGENREDNNRKTTKEMDVKLNEQSGEKGEKTIADAKRGSTKAMGEGSSTEKVDVNDRSSVSAFHRPISNRGTVTNGNYAAKSCEMVAVELKPGAVSQESRVDSNVSDEKEVGAIESNAERSVTAFWSPEKGAKGKNLDFMENQVQVFPKSKEETPISSNEVSLSEGRIWEQINAMRMIVGYKAAPQSSCMEELRCLYIFTGVEPPSSFDKPFDLREAEEKLHFLMSVVGVK